jgi:hypothetical protein
MDREDPHGIAQQFDADHRKRNAAEQTKNSKENNI